MIRYDSNCGRSLFIVKHGLECYALHGDGTREPVADREMFQKHLLHDGLFGMEAQEAQLLQYFKQDCTRCSRRRKRG